MRGEGLAIVRHPSIARAPWLNTLNGFKLCPHRLPRNPDGPLTPDGCCPAAQPRMQATTCGFTAASIVAAIPMAQRPLDHVPSMRAVDVHLAAAESKMASAARTLRAVYGQCGSSAPRRAEP